MKTVVLVCVAIVLIRLFMNWYWKGFEENNRETLEKYHKRLAEKKETLFRGDKL